MTGPGIPWRIQAGSTLVVDTGADQESVAVLAVNSGANPPTVTAVFTRPHAAGAPVSLANTPGAPPIFLKPVSVAGPGPLPQPPYPVTVQVAVDPLRSDATILAGEYDGFSWTIRPGTKLILDVGPDQEVVTVQAGPFAVDRGASTGAFQVVATRLHTEGFLITNTLLDDRIASPSPVLARPPLP
jgi:hypothetical protein